MQYGICTLSIVPARKEASGTSEMVTQLLFGEHYVVLEQGEDWIRIKTAYDHYECWISAKQHTRLSDTLFKHLEKEQAHYSNELVQVIHNKSSETRFPLTIGATLPFSKIRPLLLNLSTFLLKDIRFLPNKSPAADLLSTAFLFLNAPYLWGGRSPFGIDCSGFTQLVYKLHGYKLPRDAYQQVELGSPLSFVEEAEAGDLAFLTMKKAALYT